jgi:Cu+-exporting ATPase
LVSNTLRSEVGELVADLRSSHELTLLSGDNGRERSRFRTVFGDSATLAFDRTPIQKLEFIQNRQNAGRTVMMVGDGLNDSGALRQSDVGVAVVERIGAFSPASDVILEATRLPRLAEVLRFAKTTAGLVRASFVISTLYNVVGLSIAASGQLSPVVCAILMPLSSVTVVAFAVGSVEWRGRRAGLGPALGKGGGHP